MLSKRIIAITLVVLGILSIGFYSMSITGKFEEIGENAIAGEIISASYKPSEPKIFEKLTIEIVVKNNENKKNNYILNLKIMKKGQVKFEDDFTFTLSPKGSLSISPTYTPDEFGEYEIIARIYDQNKATLYDEKILTFVAHSDVGPFDLEIDIASKIIGLDDSLPVTVKITNVGIHGTDIGLNLDLLCANGEKISKSMYVFVNGSSDIEKQMLMKTCGIAGQHVLTTSLTLHGRELISSTNQFYVNASLPQVFLSTPHWIKVKSGEKISFGIELTNLNDFPITDIQPFIYGLPTKWVLIKPSGLNILESRKSAIFTVTINVPENTETKNYEIVVGIGSNNAFSKKEAILAVTGRAPEYYLPGSPYQFLSSHALQIILVLAAILLLCLLFKTRKKEGEDRKAILRKMKSTIH